MMLLAAIFMIALPSAFLLLYVNSTGRKPDLVLFLGSGLVTVFVASLLNWLIITPNIVTQMLWIGIVEETLKISVFYMVDNKMKSDRIIEIGLSFALWENLLYAFSTESPINFLNFYQLAIIRFPATVNHFLLAFLVIYVARQKDNRLWLLVPIAHWIGNLIILSLPPVTFVTT